MKKFIIAVTAENAEKMTENAIGVFELTEKGTNKEKMRYLLSFAENFDADNL